MRYPIRKSRDFIAGLLYVAVGIAAIILARQYAFGSAERMGPGYFPSVVGGCLSAVGAIAILRSMFGELAGWPAIAWRPLLLIPASVILLAFALPRIGMIFAIALTLLVASLARADLRFSLTGIAAAVALMAFCGLVLVRGLGLPIPLLGPWLGG